jgi:transposase
MDMEKKKKKLVEVVNDARTVLKHTEKTKVARDIRKKVDMLKRILQENIEEDRDGNTRERNHKAKPKDILVSPIDPDARFGAKSDKKRFMGYKANVTETTRSRFITNITAMRGNRPDGDTVVATIQEQKKQGIQPIKVIGDTAYGEGKHRKELKHIGTDIIAPMREKNARTKAIYPKSMFRYNEKKKTLTCPQGVTTKDSFRDYKKDLIVYHFPMSKCNKCKVQKECTNAKEGRRTVGISPVHKELMAAEKYNRTEEFREYMRLRPPIEGKLSELTRYHGLRRARYRGLKKVNLQCYFTAAAVNIKRWVKIMLEQTKPRLKEALVT